MHDQQRRSRLILFTGHYPISGGDHPFVHPEISHLANVFDEIYIANFNDGGSLPPAADLPLNCIYIGPLRHRHLSSVLRGLGNFRRLGLLFQALSLGRRSGEFRLIPDIRAALIGMAIAADPRLKDLIDDPSAKVTVYMFWGTGAAYALPWLRPNVASAAIRLHRVDLYDNIAGYRPLRPAVFASSNAILPISTHGEEYLMGRHPQIAAAQVFVRRLGVPVADQATPAPRDDTVQIVSCSSVIPVKRVERILELSLELARRGRKVKWTHFGDGTLMPALSRAADAASTNCEGLQVDLRGWTPHHDVIRHYQTVPVTMVVNLSESEGIPVSLMEAAARSIPILATNVGGTSELVGEALGSGLLVAENEPISSIASAAERIADRSLPLNPHNVWRDRFDADTNAHQTAETIKAVSMDIDTTDVWQT